MKKVKLTILSVLLAFVTAFTLVGCDRLFDESTEPTPPGASHVNITRETAEVEVGKAIQLVAQKQNNTDATVWFSSDDRIATVSATGRVEGKYPGVVTITAMAGSASDTCLVTVTGEVPEGSISYDKQVTGNGSITVKGGYELGDIATVTITPDACYELIEGSVKVNGEVFTPVDGVFSFEAVEENYIIEASFRGQVLKVSATCDANLGNVSFEEKEYRYGDEIVFSASAVENYRVYGATVNGKAIATDGTFTVKTTDYVSTNFDVQVLIKGVDVKVNKTAENGAIEIDGDLIYNEKVTFNFVAGRGYKFVSATVNGEVVTTSSYTTTLTSTVYDVTATYEIKEVTVTMNMYLDGEAMQEPRVKEYKWFDEVELTEMDFDEFPEFFNLVEFTINGKDATGMIGEDGLVKFTAENDTYDVRVYVTYAPITVNVKADNATVKFDKDAYKFGDEVTFTVTAATGYNVTGVTVPGRDLTVDGNTYTFTATDYTSPVNYTVEVTTAVRDAVIKKISVMDGLSSEELEPAKWFENKSFAMDIPEGYKWVKFTFDGEDALDKIVDGFFAFTVSADTHTVYAEIERKETIVTVNETNATVTLDKEAYKWGDEVTVSVELEEGYEIKNATVNGEAFVFTDGKYTFTTAGEKYEIVVIAEKKDASVSVTAPNATVNFDKDAYKYGDTVSFTVTAATGYKVTEVTANGEVVTATEGTYTFTMAGETASVVVATELKKATFVMSVTIDGVTESQTVPDMAEWFTPQNFRFNMEGYDLVKLTINGENIIDKLDKDMDYSFVVEADVYEIVGEYVSKTATVTVNAVNATVTLDKEVYKWGDTVSFTITTDEGYEVTGVTVNGEEVTEYTFTANGTAFEIVVTTEKKTATVTVNALNATVNGLADSYKYGDTVTFTVTADEGYEVTSVTVNGKVVTATEGTYTFIANGTAFEIVVTTDISASIITGNSIGKVGVIGSAEAFTIDLSAVTNETIVGDLTSAAVGTTPFTTATKEGDIVTLNRSALTSVNGDCTISLVFKDGANVTVLSVPANVVTMYITSEADLSLMASTIV
ncbi:MAG: Ig-like domain-containing protein, partial [Clostridia bacterium]|nr:Ig-like domain-containing protein [Clostridia bacterium]